jgi:nitroreductase
MILGWEVDPYGTHGRRLTGCLQAAAQAPSVHNSQPWRFRVGQGQIDVLLDSDRILKAMDPCGREAWISVGAALLNLRVAILAAGRVPVSAVLPDPRRQPNLAASLTYADTYRPTETVQALAAAIPRRHTNRRPFRDIGVREELVDQFVAAARTEGATLAVLDPDTRRSVLALAATANHRQNDDPAYLDELRYWTNVPPGSVDGIPAWAWGPIDDRGALPLRDLGAGYPQLPRRHARFEDAPTVAIVYTAGDGPRDWLRAGQAMERILLTATVHGVATTPITAPTEQPELRALLYRDAGPVAQIILRMGYGTPTAMTPRRPVRDTIDLIDEERT